MKLKFTLLFLAVASIAMAQKRELRKIERAIENENFIEALDLFNSIDENAVEDKYAGAYQFYKASVLVDLSGARKASLNDLRAAKAAVEKAKNLEFENPKLEAMLDNFMQVRKLEIANEKVASGDYKEALSLVEELYASNPSNLDMLYNAGNLAYSNEMFDKAIEKYDILLEKNYTGENTSYVAVNAMGVEESFLTKKLRDYAVLSKSHTNPTSETSISKLGGIVLKVVWLYTNKDEKAKAKLIYETALGNYSEDISLKLVKADIYLTLGMMDEYKEAVENTDLNITDPKVYDNLGEAAMKSKNYESAIRYFQSSLEIVSGNYFALVNLSNAYLETGNLQETNAKDQKRLYLKAVKSLEKAHEIKPEERGVMGTLISLYDFLEMNDKSAAIKLKM
jgi:tetratricopeptide (TPR) repeat protein